MAEPVAPPAPVLEKRRAVPGAAAEPVPAPAAASDSPAGGSRIKLIVAAVAAVVVVGAAGGYYYLSAKPAEPAPIPTPTLPAEETTAAAEQPLAISDPALDGATTADHAATPAAEPEPEPAAAPAPVPAPAPAPAPVPAPVAEKPAKPVKVTPPAAPVSKPSGLESVITDSLSEASHCMSQRKYDCAIANANAVLRMDTGNRYALDIKRKAKEAQDKALSQIQIE
ncbi:hypothetical protein O3299_24600 [Janthinobacterium sp. SUN176]|uniref:hypothetical protein n=1 Tax=Janthinobacterium sp. SUN176 TaxID=3014788 RepID=UPI0027141647|nr:hypothetical protein [Janthinobacterium sp. SUN176]MDO8074727.1 hypothetical protein [Janthinobacterium sp. SUN176]